MTTKITLNSAQQLSSPQATWIEWCKIVTDLREKSIEAVLVWHDNTSVIPVNGKLEQNHTIINIPDNPDTPGDEKNNKFNKCWKYTIKADDAGKDLGQLFIKQIWQELKADLLTAGNDGNIDEV